MEYEYIVGAELVLGVFFFLQKLPQSKHVRGLSLAYTTPPNSLTTMKDRTQKKEGGHKKKKGSTVIVIACCFSQSCELNWTEVPSSPEQYQNNLFEAL